ncbi:glycosyltransferase family 25 protein [Aminobacter sp. Piv2-1]|uniref:glycosyltransferase family 25 protein n=1 Tax=Aminobacter sp. Piv2-1 TaxID=3031122 RepID=UPI003096423F
MKIEAFIIHLERATARRQQVDALAAALPMPANIVDAVDGLTLSDDDIAKVYRRRLHSPRYPFELRKTEIACFLSHRKAWQSILDKGLDAGLIVEDDVDVDVAKLVEILSAVQQTFGSADYLRFPQKMNENGQIHAEMGASLVFEPRLPGLGMVMQLVGPGAAAGLLETTCQFDRPVDTTIQLRRLHPIRVLSSRPICVREVSSAFGGSMIQNKGKRIGEVLAREIKRSIYRFAVRRGVDVAPK